jgi:hypothetical protein
VAGAERNVTCVYRKLEPLQIAALAFGFRLERAPYAYTRTFSTGIVHVADFGVNQICGMHSE